MIKSFEIYMLLFFLYSFLGWANETIRISFQNRKFVNRGFLIGPICPIYGYGAIIISLLLKSFVYNPIILFIMSILVCGLLEYLTSYFMEKIFNARWWDYSNRKMNINGRVCAENLVLFGIASIVILYISNPFFINLLSLIPINILQIILLIILIIYIADNIASFKIILNIKQVSKEIKDNTIEISEKVKNIIHSKSYFHRRIIEAYPNIKDRLEYRKWNIISKFNKAKIEVQNKIDNTKSNFEQKKIKNNKFKT